MHLLCYKKTEQAIPSEGIACLNILDISVDTYLLTQPWAPQQQELPAQREQPS